MYSNREIETLYWPLHLIVSTRDFELSMDIRPRAPPELLAQVIQHAHSFANHTNPYAINLARLMDSSLAGDVRAAKKIIGHSLRMHWVIGRRTEWNFRHMLRLDH